MLSNSSYLSALTSMLSSSIYQYTAAVRVVVAVLVFAAYVSQAQHTAQRNQPAQSCQASMCRSECDNASGQRQSWREPAHVASSIYTARWVLKTSEGIEICPRSTYKNNTRSYSHSCGSVRQGLTSAFSFDLDQIKHYHLGTIFVSVGGAKRLVHACMHIYTNKQLFLVGYLYEVHALHACILHRVFPRGAVDDGDRKKAETGITLRLIQLTAEGKERNSRTYTTYSSMYMRACSARRRNKLAQLPSPPPHTRDHILQERMHTETTCCTKGSRHTSSFDLASGPPGRRLMMMMTARSFF